ncbi:amidohydrolase family protein [Brevibacterium album]|uniref:amidohydrolase family protein n=1 Tax=Brevibacterium album TaxID=417948 RepID=UPI0004093F16|nr:amidohydrolase family protein [Brevibacterium album]
MTGTRPPPSARSTRRRLLRTGAALAGGALALGASGALAWHGMRYRAQAPHSGALVIRGAQVLCGEGLAPAPGASVLVRDGVIAEVGDRVTSPADAQLLEAPGTTVMPGLIDAHVHLGYPELEDGEEFGPGDLPRHIWNAARHVPDARRALLAHGVTTVRSLGDELAWVLDLREAVSAGTLEGPRILCAGPVLTTPGGHPVSTHGTDAEGDSVRLPRTPAEAGADGIEHLTMRDPAAATADLEHTTGRRWPEGLLERMAAAGTVLAPTLAVEHSARAAASGAGAEARERVRARLREAHAAGIPVIAGSDAAVPGVPFGAGLVEEVAELSAAGLGHREALRAATSVAARALGARDTGAVEPGRAADLLLVRGDPLSDLGALCRVSRVLRAGRLVIGG